MEKGTLGYQGIPNPGYQQPNQGAPYAPPQQGAYPAPGAGYAPTQPGFAPAPQQGGGYAPAPQQGGGYVPAPQQGGGYAPALHQGTGYTPTTEKVQYSQQPAPGPYQQYPPQQSAPQGGNPYPPQGAVQASGPYSQASAPGAPVQWDPSTASAYQGEMGEEVDENAQLSEPVPSAPPSFESVVSGYENTNYDGVDIGPPPSYEQTMGEVAHIDSAKVSSLSEDDAKDALLAYVAQQCCYGKGAAKDMDIKDIQSTSALHYTLETFTESRSTKWSYVPYKGGFVDGPEMGPAPGPWDIQCQFSALFVTETKHLEVPHTASVCRCHTCHGCGFNRCWKCYGRGRVRCSWCHGSGHRSEMHEGRSRRVHCHSCHGSGRKRCMTCMGSGCVRCRECEGYGKIKKFIQLTIKFTNRLSDHIVERTDMPDHLIRDVTGDLVFEQTALRVCPIEGYVEQEINRRAAEIVGSHATSWPNERILQQRQKLSSIPVYECRFKYSDKEGRFWVYGHQRSVFTQDYPHTCCCCTIL